MVAFLLLTAYILASAYLRQSRLLQIIVGQDKLHLMSVEWLTRGARGFNVISYNERKCHCFMVFLI